MKKLLLLTALLAACKLKTGYQGTYEGVAAEDLKVIRCGYLARGSDILHCFAGTNQYTCVETGHPADSDTVRTCRITTAMLPIIGVEK